MNENRKKRQTVLVFYLFPSGHITGIDRFIIRKNKLTDN